LRIKFLEEVQERLIHQTTKEGFTTDNIVAIHAAHFAAGYQAPSR